MMAQAGLSYSTEEKRTVALKSGTARFSKLFGQKFAVYK